MNRTIAITLGIGVAVGYLICWLSINISDLTDARYMEALKDHHSMSLRGTL